MQTARHPETIEKKQGQDIESGRMLSKMTNVQRAGTSGRLELDRTDSAFTQIRNN